MIGPAEAGYVSLVDLAAERGCVSAIRRGSASVYARDDVGGVCGSRDLLVAEDPARRSLVEPGAALEPVAIEDQL
jgi:hypothetical protein